MATGSGGGPEREGERVGDGRVLRGERSREAIVNALFDLIGEGSPQPTAEQVAERAGVQVRTVFRHFSDMESLHGEVASRLRSELAPLAAGLPRGGSVAERARELVRNRALVFERLAPFKRSANLQRWRYAHLQQDHERLVRELRSQLVAMFPELGAGASPAAAALELVTSLEAWDRLRLDQRLGVERARAAMEYAALAVLATLDGPVD